MLKTKEAAEKLFNEDTFVERWREMMGLILGQGAKK
jgi:hypothetical protein